MKENNVVEVTTNTFENIKHIYNDGNKYWLGRELMIALKYTKW